MMYLKDLETTYSACCLSTLSTSGMTLEVSRILKDSFCFNWTLPKILCMDLVISIKLSVEYIWSFRILPTALSSWTMFTLSPSPKSSCFLLSDNSDSPSLLLARSRNSAASLNEAELCSSVSLSDTSEDDGLEASFGILFFS